MSKKIYLPSEKAVSAGAHEVWLRTSGYPSTAQTDNARAAISAAYAIDIPNFLADERRKIIMEFNTQQMSRLIKDEISRGSDSGTILNLITDAIRPPEECV